RDGPAVRGDGQPVDAPTPLARRPGGLPLAILHPPESHGAVDAGGGQQLAIPEERDACDLLGVTPQSDPLPARGDVPYVHEAGGPGPGEQVASRVEGQGPNRTLLVRDDGPFADLLAQYIDEPLALLALGDRGLLARRLSEEEEK